jgi:diguanylate cyclase
MHVIPKDDPAQAIRIRRFFLAVVAYIIWLILIFYCHYMDLIRLSVWKTTIIYSLLIVINIVFYGILRTGLNKRLADPSMTLPQMIIATVGAMVVIYFTDQIRALMLLTYFTTFIFGVFRLNLRQYLGLALFALASYCLLVLMLYHNHPEQMDTRIEILQLFIFGTVLVWFSFIGSYISSLRNRLSASNHDLSHALKTIEELAIHDDLTHAYNRRHMFQELHKAKNMADRSEIPFSIAILDLDHFKQVNDTFGHQKGDDVLRRLVQEVADDLRETDIIARYGGEEFLVIMPGTDIDGAADCTQKIRKRLLSVKYDGLPELFRVTISAGVTTYQHPESIDEMICRADSALYRAKSKGRNRLEIEFPKQRAYRKKA